MAFKELALAGKPGVTTLVLRANARLLFDTAHIIAVDAKLNKTKGVKLKGSVTTDNHLYFHLSPTPFITFIRPLLLVLLLVDPFY